VFHFEPKTTHIFGICIFALEVLDVSNNKIKDLTSAIRGMTALEALNLSHNPLREVPQGLWSISGLVHFFPLCFCLEISSLICFLVCLQTIQHKYSEI